MDGTILIVDDEYEFRGEFKDCFAEYSVMEASNGEEALRILKKPNEIDLVILDVKMPGLSGIEVLKQIKNMAPELGIIILTGHSSKDVAIEALKGHADDYIEKPINLSKTREIVEKVIGAKRDKNNLSIGSDSDDKIERARRFIQRNCLKKISLQSVADVVYLSPKYLSRIFKEKTGRSFLEYKLEVKIEKTKGFLKGSGYTINQIAEKLEYQNAESLVRIFKKIVGCTPAEYRRKSFHRKK